MVRKHFQFPLIEPSWIEPRSSWLGNQVFRAFGPRIFLTFWRSFLFFSKVQRAPPIYIFFLSNLAQTYMLRYQPKHTLQDSVIFVSHPSNFSSYAKWRSRGSKRPSTLKISRQSLCCRCDCLNTDQQCHIYNRFVLRSLTSMHHWFRGPSFSLQTMGSNNNLIPQNHRVTF